MKGCQVELVSFYKTKMLLQITSLLSILCLTQSDTIRESERVTNWGNWGNMDECPSGTFVKSILVRIEYNQLWGDDTGLNAVHLGCYGLEEQLTPGNNHPVKTLTSSEGPWGKWVPATDYCYNGLAIGFQMQTETPLGGGDDTAANDMVLICVDSTHTYKTIWHGADFGGYRSEIKCPSQTAICGLQTQVEPDQGNGDDTALNNVRVHCCDLPNPAKTCHPSDEWDAIVSISNVDGTTELPYTYTRKKGVTFTTSNSESSSVVEQVAAKVGFSVGVPICEVLGLNFETSLSTSTTTQHSWSRTDTSTFTEETTESLEVKIPPGCEFTFSQLKGKCGPYVIMTNTIKRVDKCPDGEKEHYLTLVPNDGYVPSCALTVVQLISVTVALITIF